MSDLKLIPPDQPTPFEQRLLDAVANESPSAEQRARVRSALGLPAVAPPPASALPVGRRALLLKAGGGLLVASGALLAWGFGARHGPSADQHLAQGATLRGPVAAPALAATEPSAADSVAGPQSAPSAARSAVVAPTSTPEAHEEGGPVKRTSKPVPVDPSADLSEQLRLIDAARSAVAAGNASAASAALRSYRTRFPRGPFGQEAAVLQIKTLELQGNHALAAAQAKSFLARYPNSPHESVVRRIAGH